MQYTGGENGTSDATQSVTYYYDNSYPGGGLGFTPPQNGLGRLTGVAFGGGVVDAYEDTYSYLFYMQSSRLVIGPNQSVRSHSWSGGCGCSEAT